MSCGNPHEFPCDQAMLVASGWLNGEVDDDTADRLLQHFFECGPCVDQSVIERMLQVRVAQAWHAQAHAAGLPHDHAPEELRERVIARIEHISFSYTQSEGTQVFGFYSETTHIEHTD